MQSIVQSGKFAEEYCLDRGYKFRIITEDHLKGKKPTPKSGF